MGGTLTPQNAMASLANGGVPPAATDTTQNPSGTPQTAPAQATPAAAPTPAPAPANVPGSPDANAKVAGGTTQNQVSPHAQLFDKILKTMTGGDIKVVNPDGTVRTVQQSRGQMGRAIVAAALAGFMTPTKYRDTPYGPVVDYSASAAAAGQAGQQSIKNYRNAPQQMSDEQQTRKLKFLENNARMFSLGMSMANAKRAEQEQHAQDAKPFMDVLHQYDNDRPNDDSVPKAVLYEGLTHEEAMKQAAQPGSGITENNFVWDGGTRPVRLPNGKMDTEATYAIINPALQKLQVTPQVADKLAKVSPQWDNLHEKIGGPVNIPQSMWVHAWHDYSNYNMVNEAMNRLAKTLDPKAKDFDISDTIRSDKRMLPALDKIVNGLAHPENGQEEGQNPANLLDNISKYAPQLLDKLGMNSEQAFEKVTELSAKRIAEIQRAKNAGSTKEPADPTTVARLIQATQSLPPDQQKDVLPILQASDVTKADAQKAATMIKGYQTSNQSDQTRRLLAGGDPTEIAKFAYNTARGDLNQIDKLPSRGDARIKAMNQLHDEAAGLGLDTTKFTDSYLDTKKKMLDDWNSTNRKSTGSQVRSFDAYIGHSGAAMDALNALKSETIGLTRQPLINVASDEIGKQLTNDTNWKRWETSLAPVRNEIENFLAAGYKPSETEQQTINQILDKHETPARIAEAIKSLAETADIRLASLGKGYTETMDSNYRGLLSPDASNTLKKMGIHSKAAAYSGALVKGWDQQGNLQTLTNVPLAKQYVAAAGGDRQRAIDLARANGWILQ